MRCRIRAVGKALPQLSSRRSSNSPLTQFGPLLTGISAWMRDSPGNPYQSWPAQLCISGKPSSTPPSFTEEVELDVCCRSLFQQLHHFRGRHDVSGDRSQHSRDFGPFKSSTLFASLSQRLASLVSAVPSAGALAAALAAAAAAASASPSAATAAGASAPPPAAGGASEFSKTLQSSGVIDDSSSRESRPLLSTTTVTARPIGSDGGRIDWERRHNAIIRGFKINAAWEQGSTSVPVRAYRHA
ncbi:hypothetical protein FOZ63_019170 [Perkinsus olseni]|uniref:Uncharacterized protein n=1 Tax=Perkinsus olseni TaxID=32597 RepID=A0A7J6NCV2_PEROL|nr:hypothetical protein FOZ60_011926 [Perkinsus olseni]KAF4743306.1 hypothetical protein FOZ63_019170 [Perkinsus olseni]